jgi:hypothetical protein
MRASAFSAILACVPAILVAQASPPTQPPKTPPGAQAGVQATSNGNVDLPGTLSAGAKTKIDATIQAAHAKNIPDQPIRDRIADGQAKGATEAQIVEAAQGVETRLEASQAALIQAGRAKPQDAEIASGAQAMERGATAAQISALVKHAPADRSLAVSFDVLSKLTAKGEAVDAAIEKIAAKLDAGATDAVVSSLVSGANPPAGTNPPAEGATATGNAAAAGTAAVTAGKGVTAGVTGAVKGAVSGVVPPKKP